MSERFAEFYVERDGSKFNYVTIDLENVVHFGQHRDDTTQIRFASTGHCIAPVPYSEFKKIHAAYHSSKALPTALAPSVQIAPLTKEVPSVLTTTAAPPVMTSKATPPGGWTKEWTELQPPLLDEEPDFTREYTAIEILRNAGHAIVMVLPEELKGVKPHKLEDALYLHVEDEIKELKED